MAEMVVFKGDDTNGRFGNNLSISLDVASGIDLTNCSARIIYQGIVKEIEDIGGKTSLDFSFSAEETSSMKVGRYFATFQIIDEDKRVRTVCTNIPITCTDQVARCYRGLSSFIISLFNSCSWSSISDKPETFPADISNLTDAQKSAINSGVSSDIISELTAPVETVKTGYDKEYVGDPEGHFACCTHDTVKGLVFSMNTKKPMLCVRDSSNPNIFNFVDSETGDCCFKYQNGYGWNVSTMALPYIDTTTVSYVFGEMSAVVMKDAIKRRAVADVEEYYEGSFNLLNFRVSGGKLYYVDYFKSEEYTEIQYGEKFRVEGWIETLDACVKELRGNELVVYFYSLNNSVRMVIAVPLTYHQNALTVAESISRAMSNIRNIVREVVAEEQA